MCAQVGHATMGAITRYLLQPRELLMMPKSKSVPKIATKEQDLDEDNEEEDEDDEDDDLDDGDYTNEELEMILYGDSDEESDEEITPAEIVSI